MADDASPFTNRRAGEAFFVEPPGDVHGPGVLVLHSWWGLNAWVRDFCRRLSSEGYTVLAPDLFDGVQPVTESEGEAVLGGVDPDELSGLVMSSAHTLRVLTGRPERPIATIGFSMGASLALWVTARLGTVINAAVAFYGTQAVDFDDANAAFLGHYAENDHIVSDDDRVATESFIRLGGQDTEFHVYPGTRHWFFEEGEHHDPEAAELAWTRTTEFLARQVDVAGNG
jgi:carboxymethylenebutenolidase